MYGAQYCWLSTGCNDRHFLLIQHHTTSMTPKSNASSYRLPTALNVRS